MARPQKQTADYFPHDANASDSDTLTILQGRWGNDGYSFFFKLLEKLAGSEGHVIDCRNPLKWQLLLAKTRLNEETGEEMMKVLADLGAIDPELWSKHRLIWCQELVDSIADVYKNRRRPIPARPTTTEQNAITTDDNALTTGESTQSKVKKSKVNNTKKQSIYQEFEVFWEAYPKKKSKGDAEKAFGKVNPGKQLLAIMLTKIEQAKKSADWLKDNGQFIPYPATWLNRKCWEDELAEKGELDEKVEGKRVRGSRPPSNYRGVW